MSYDTSSDTKVVNLNPMGYSPEAASVPSPVPTAMDGGKRPLSSSGSSSGSSSSSGSRRQSHRKSRDRDTSSSEDDYEEEDYSDTEEQDGKQKVADKVVVKKDGSVSSRSSKSSEASSYTEEESEEEEDAISMTSTEILENDPLFFVLSRIFVTHDKKKNIADLLQEIVDLLKEQRDHRLQRMHGGHPGHSSAIPMQKY